MVARRPRPALDRGRAGRLDGLAAGCPRSTEPRGTVLDQASSAPGTTTTPATPLTRRQRTAVSVTRSVAVRSRWRIGSRPLLGAVPGQFALRPHPDGVPLEELPGTLDLSGAVSTDSIAVAGVRRPVRQRQSCPSARPRAVPRPHRRGGDPGRPAHNPPLAVQRRLRLAVRRSHRWRAPRAPTCSSASRRRGATRRRRLTPAGPPQLTHRSQLTGRVKYVAGHDRDRADDRPDADERRVDRPRRRAARRAPAEDDRPGHVPRRASSTSAWPGCTSPRATAASACRPKLQKLHQRARRRRGRRAAPGGAQPDRLRHVRPDRRTCGAPRSRRRATCARCSPARRSGASCSASRAPGRTSPACRRRASATATSGSSTARRCGPRWPTSSRWGLLVARTDPEAAQAPGHDRVRRRHARARRRGPAAAPDHRRGRVQRGVLHRRPHPRPSGSATSATAGRCRSPR